MQGSVATKKDINKAGPAKRAKSISPAKKPCPYASPPKVQLSAVYDMIVANDIRHEINRFDRSATLNCVKKAGAPLNAPMNRSRYPSGTLTPKGEKINIFNQSVIPGSNERVECMCPDALKVSKGPVAIPTLLISALRTVITGVAAVTASAVIGEASAAGQQSSANNLPAMAGFRKLCPIPPNTTFMTILPKSVDKMTICGAVCSGKLNATTRPVTTVLRQYDSLLVIKHEGILKMIEVVIQVKRKLTSAPEMNKLQIT